MKVNLQNKDLPDTLQKLYDAGQFEAHYLFYHATTDSWSTERPPGMQPAGLHPSLHLVVHPLLSQMDNKVGDCSYRMVVSGRVCSNRFQRVLACFDLLVSEV
jgi:hypothetical protein